MVAASGYLRVVLPAPQSSLPWPPGEATWQGVVTATAESPRSRRVTLHLLPDAVVQATLKKDSLSSALAPGDALRFRAQIVAPANIDSLSRFDYAAWLRRHGVVGTAFVWDRWQRLSPAVADSLAARLPWTARMQLAASRWRHALSRRYAAAVPSDRDRAVLSALTLGDRQRLTRDIRTTYSNAGVAHLLALSGLHLGGGLVDLRPFHIRYSGEIRVPGQNHPFYYLKTQVLFLLLHSRCTSSDGGLKKSHSLFAQFKSPLMPNNSN